MICLLSINRKNIKNYAQKIQLETVSIVFLEPFINMINNDIWNVFLTGIIQLQ